MNAEQTALEKSSLFLFRDGEMGIVVEKKKKSKKWRILIVTLILFAAENA